MQEYGHFTEKERKEIMEHVRQLMIITREGAALDLITDDKKDAQFISDSFSKWISIKQELQKYIQKTVIGWKKPIKDEEYEPTGM
jgi:phage host-nuclease inhibitor protein Gam